MRLWRILARALGFLCHQWECNISFEGSQILKLIRICINYRVWPQNHLLLIILAIAASLLFVNSPFYCLNNIKAHDMCIYGMGVLTAEPENTIPVSIVAADFVKCNTINHEYLARPRLWWREWFWPEFSVRAKKHFDVIGNFLLCR